jgi:hypothetical protein
MAIFYTIKGRGVGVSNDLNEIPDGFGSLYHAFISAIAFCEHMKYIYIHTPLVKVSRYSDVDLMNCFIGINNNSLTQFPNEHDLFYEVPCSFTVIYSKNPEVFYTSHVIETVRSFYYSTPKPHIENIDIAIHIRRGDISSINNDRYTSNEIYKNTIVYLKTIYPNYKITIFSEGNTDDFKDLGIEPSQLKLNEDVLATFHSLVTAKILVIAKSSFSFVAALLNKNQVLYNDTSYLSPFSHWIDISNHI